MLHCNISPTVKIQKGDQWYYNHSFYKQSQNLNDAEAGFLILLLQV